MVQCFIHVHFFCILNWVYDINVLWQWYWGEGNPSETTDIPRIPKMTWRILQWFFSSFLIYFFWLVLSAYFCIPRSRRSLAAFKAVCLNSSPHVALQIQCLESFFLSTDLCPWLSRSKTFSATSKTWKKISRVLDEWVIPIYIFEYNALTLTLLLFESILNPGSFNFFRV